MDQKSLAQRLEHLPLGEIRFFETIDSTNQQAAVWAQEGAPDLSLVIADEQSQGRGRSGRKWFTYRGSALAFTLILRPNPFEEQATAALPRITGLGALAVCRTLQKQHDLPAQIKWPNDVLIHRRKCCGILTEANWAGSQLTAIFLGIGINVATHSVPPARVLNFPATSLEGELHTPLDRLALLEGILGEILHWRRNLATRAFIRTWEACLAFRNEVIQVTFPEDIALEGVLLGLGPHGALRLLTSQGKEITLHHGEITALRGKNPPPSR